jgi:hypothetical protein
VGPAFGSGTVKFHRWKRPAAGSAVRDRDDRSRGNPVFRRAGPAVHQNPPLPQHPVDTRKGHIRQRPPQNPVQPPPRIVPPGSKRHTPPYTPRSIHASAVPLYLPLPPGQGYFHPAGGRGVPVEQRQGQDNAVGVQAAKPGRGAQAAAGKNQARPKGGRPVPGPRLPRREGGVSL